mmetsp:Transcript_71251/g.204406  ORF Transcript_71251/g.204406 Transcript_71251/m.204406 type:complete len:331 (+) Transcript_71251:460-1452(+)
MLALGCQRGQLMIGREPLLIGRESLAPELLHHVAQAVLLVEVVDADPGLLPTQRSHHQRLRNQREEATQHHSTGAGISALVGVLAVRENVELGDQVVHAEVHRRGTVAAVGPVAVRAVDARGPRRGGGVAHRVHELLREVHDAGPEVADVGQASKHSVHGERVAHPQELEAKSGVRQAEQPAEGPGGRDDILPVVLEKIAMEEGEPNRRSGSDVQRHNHAVIYGEAVHQALQRPCTPAKPSETGLDIRLVQDGHKGGDDAEDGSQHRRHHVGILASLTLGIVVLVGGEVRRLGERRELGASRRRLRRLRRLRHRHRRVLPNRRRLRRLHR